MTATINPVWANNGREVFFVSGRELVAAEYETTPTFRVVTTVPLFTISFDYFVSMSGNGDFYDVAADDQRFLMVRLPGGVAAASRIVVQNFFEELKRLVPNN